MTYVIVICLLFSLFWSMAPFLGWSHYSFEASLTGCCVEYKSRNINVISYNIAMFIFVFIIPFGFILESNIKLLFLIINILCYFINNSFICLKLLSKNMTDRYSLHKRPMFTIIYFMFVFI